MSLRVDMGWLIATLLVSVRVASATAIAPVFGPARIPASARVILTLALSALFVSAVPTVATPITSAADLLIAVLVELVIGFSFAFGFIFAYGATQLAGRTLDIQIGFGAASVLNPTTETVAPLLGSLLGMVAIAIFLAMNGHLVLVRALSASLSAMPPGQSAFDVDWGHLMRHSAVVFTFALALAGPVMFMFLLSDLAMAVFARSMPQLNVLVLGFAIKITLGLIGLAMSIRFAGAVLEDLFGTTFSYWEQIAVGR